MFSKRRKPPVVQNRIYPVTSSGFCLIEDQEHDSEYIFIAGNTVAVALGSCYTKVHLKGKAVIYACDNVRIEAYGDSVVCAYNNARVYAHERATVYAYDGSLVSARGGDTTVYSQDDSKVSLFRARLISENGPRVFARGHSEVRSYVDNPNVEIFDNAIFEQYWFYNSHQDKSFCLMWVFHFKVFNP